jgi:predicted ArsR family transcriptional regulator
MRNRRPSPFRPHSSNAVDDGSLGVRSCPSHAVARDPPELVCRMNRGFIEGTARVLRNQTLEAAPDPTSGQCRVLLRPGRGGAASTAGPGDSDRPGSGRSGRSG